MVTFIFIFNMGWRIIDIEQGQQVKLFLNNLIILKDLKKITIPLCDIGTIVFDNTRTIITIRLINELTKNNILVIVCDEKHLPSSLIIPQIGNFNSLKILEKQINWDAKFKHSKWKEIIIHKILNQIEILKYFKLKFNQTFFEQMIAEIQPFDLTNREGHAAKVYWHILFGNQFSRNLENNINRMLNYGYSILYSYFSRSIVKKGLDPRISIFHKSFNNYFALSSDLMEEFRPLIDWYVYKTNQSKDDILIVDIKTNILRLFSQKCMIVNKRYFIPQAIDIYIDNLINEREIPKVNFLYDEY